MNLRSLFVISFALTSNLTLAACGSDSSDTGSASSSGAGTGAGGSSSSSSAESSSASGSESSSGTGAGGSSSSSSAESSSSGSTSSSASGSSSSAASGSSSSSGGGTIEINGCDEASAEDHTKDAAATVVTFGGAVGLKYSPACIVIKKNQIVDFQGNFNLHPIVGGEVASDGTLTPDASSPIKSTTTGTDAKFSFPNAGTYPYYCGFHNGLGMKGAVFVK